MWIEAQAYSAVLLDGALLQISFDFVGTDLVGHRLVYFPSPFNYDSALLRDLPILDVVDLYMNSRDELPRLVSPLRFEYDPAGAGPGHPACHLTTISSQCRWAISTPLSPGHFIRFIFQHFYRELYLSHRFLREWPQRASNRSITEEEEMRLHISIGRAIVA